MKYFDMLAAFEFVNELRQAAEKKDPSTYQQPVIEKPVEKPVENTHKDDEEEMLSLLREIKEKINIPENVDVFISHAPCFDNKTGQVLQKNQFNTGADYGSKVLEDYVLNKRNIRYMFSGHIHSGEHKMKLWNNKTYVKCCSLKDENYKVVFNIEYFDI